LILTRIDFVAFTVHIGRSGERSLVKRRPLKGLFYIFSNNGVPICTSEKLFGIEVAASAA
jgi:hypothetical protein